mgnify:CR=1 FL=1
MLVKNKIPRNNVTLILTCNFLATFSIETLILRETSIYIDHNKDVSLSSFIRELRGRTITAITICCSKL